MNLFDSAVLDDPYLSYDHLRASPKLVRTAEGHPVLSRYHEVRAALLDHEVYSSADTNGASRRTLPVLVGTDPPEHTRLRRFASGSFSVQSRRAWEPVVASRIEHLVASAVRSARIEAVTQLCTAIPVAILAVLLGVDEPSLRRLLEQSPRSHPGVRRRLLADFFRQQRLHCLANPPRDDLLAQASRPSPSGDCLDEVEFIALGVLLLAAGIDSPRDLLANLLIEMAGTPSVWEELAGQPQVADSFVEEAIRFTSPVQGVFRTTTRRIGHRDSWIERGAHVLLLLGSANRDGECWDAADQFRATRYTTDPPPPAHLGLGAGIHACMGATLARFSARETVRELLRTGTRFRLEGCPVRGRNPYFRTVKRLDLSFSK